MHFDIHFRKDFTDRVEEIADEIRDWNNASPEVVHGIEALKEYAQHFNHCAFPDRPFWVGGADGSGDFPCVRYGDSTVYLVNATARLYVATLGGLTEKRIASTNVLDILWLPEDKVKAQYQYKEFFSRLIGETLETICEESDYYQLTKAHGGGVPSPVDLIDTLILPPSHEASNISVQLLPTAEIGALTRLIRALEVEDIGAGPIYLLEDTTMTLPMVSRKNTLFFEIAKRYICKIARDRGVVFLTISKSHNMPHMDLIEDMVKEFAPEGEHWFIRIPGKQTGEQETLPFGTRSVPTVGAVTYIFKFHKTTQPMRLDMDLEYWYSHIWSEDKDQMRAREQQLFRDLDFASHDQRCYGYPYPIKASHDMASLKDAERVALRKQIIDAAVRKGCKRKNFIDPSIQTGHA